MKKTDSITVTSGIYMLCKSIIGASSVLLAGVFKDLGIILGTLMFMFMTIINVYSLKYIMQVAKETDSNDLTEIGEYVDKRKGKIFVTVFLYFTCIIPLIFYIHMSTEYYHAVLEFFDIHFISEDVVRIITACLCALLCIIFRKVDKLQFVNIIGLVSISFLCIYSVWNFIKEFKNIDLVGLNKFPENLKKLSRFSVICFAYCSQFSIISITSNIDSNSDCNTVIWAANIFSGIFYILTGFCGYALSPNVEGNFLNGIEKTKTTTFLKFALGTVNVFTYPLIMIPTRSSFHFFISGLVGNKTNFSIDGIESTFIVLLCYLSSFVVKKRENILNAAFFITGSVVMFALPSYFYVRIMSKKINLFNSGIILINLLLTMFGLYMAGSLIYEMISTGN